MKKVNLFRIVFSLFFAISLNGAAFAQTTFTFSRTDLIQLQSRYRILIQSLIIIPGFWTVGDWDNRHVVDNFVEDLGDLSDQLEDGQELIEQTLENPKPSAKGKILSQLKSAAGHLKGMKSVVQQHLDNPTAKADVLSRLESIENTLNESIELVTSEQ